MSGQQLGFAEAFLDPRLRAAGKLGGLAEVIDWAPVEALAAALHSATNGRPPYAPAAMLRALYLQALYDLSDPGLEEALLVRLDFRRFCGFSLSECTPDETTLCRFRNAAAAAGVLEAAFGEVNRQLAAKKLMVKKGRLIDATIVAAASRRPPVTASEIKPSGIKPSGIKPSGIKPGSQPELPREPEASFTQKGGRSFFGWWLHVGVDQGSGLVRRAVVTPAHVNESVVAEALIVGDERAVYADRGYESKERRARLQAAGIKDRIMHRRHKHLAKLPHWQGVRNQLISRRRAPVEAVFGTLKRSSGRARSRFCGLLRTAADLFRVLTVYNLRRAIRLTTP
jgi:IS5 family transposase